MSIRNFILLLSICICSCSPYPSDVKNALKYAGSNRRQLEKVLEHYSKTPSDSLKLRAAEFLIANMPGHWSFNSETLNDYYSRADTILTSKIPWKSKIEQLNRVSLEYPGIMGTTTEDIHVITAQYLIKNIEQAFDVWQNGPWAKHVLFDDFCEYLLPYKITDGQPLDNWRDSLKGRFCETLDLLKYNQYYRNSASRAAQIVRNNMRKHMWPKLTMDFEGIPLLGASNIAKLPAGTCNEYAQVVLAVMRNNGIPVSIDMLPQWPYRGGGGGHSWNYLPDALRSHVIFEELNGVGPGGALRPYSPLGKVYRNTYAINRKLFQMQTEGQVPELFSNIFLKDVTAEYAPVADAVVDVHPKMKINRSYAYLAVFNNKEWEPIAFGDVTRNSVKFRNMCKNIVYLPVYCTTKGLKPVNYPFILEHSGNVRHLIPDTTKRRSVVLSRKYPVFSGVFDMTMRTVGAKIQVSNTNDFKKAVTVHDIDEWFAAGVIQLPDSLPKYRYWRFRSPAKEYCNIAELMFFGPNDIIPYSGEIIGLKEMYKNDSIYSKEKAFDHDPLTYFHSATRDSAWVGIDFGEPVRVEKIVYLPRSDDNNIRLGDEYELFYWDKIGWCSLGKQKAKDIELKFDCVPGNVLLWLRDLTRGSEERIFTYENGGQVWW
ncbi:discoidin domain-containing protein [Mangrovibacterium marinum]|uniref:discoidin domain-containing protein n=1 Tax=Mangrovibacterium marinum TaxID=1639118 RepID=UPI002A188222|nr:discoidin domain-containing protein [Mangrovibacterium marinum]